MATTMTASIASKAIQTEQGMSLSGDLVFSSVADLLEQGNTKLKQYLSQNPSSSSFVIDCKEMERIDSAGIALLLEWQRQCKNAEKNCRFEGLSNQAQALIEAYRLQSLIAA